MAAVPASTTPTASTTPAPSGQQGAQGDKGDSIIGAVIQDILLKNQHIEHKIETLIININSPDFKLDIENDFYIMASTGLDLPYYARMEIKSADNYFRTSKPDFEGSLENNNQVFERYINIVTSNYGASAADFVPFNLVFVRVSFVSKILKAAEKGAIAQLFNAAKDFFKQTVNH